MSKRRSRSDSPTEPLALQENTSRISSTTRNKRARRQSHLQSLSDELVLKVLSFLTTSELTRCQQVCRRLYRIAGDDQVWKSAFYDRFVRPRASRLPGLARGITPVALPAYSSRSSKWLDDAGLLSAQNTHWKQLYKLRHNWNRGRCGVTEIGISTVRSEPPLSVQLRRGIVFTIDSVSGLQAWRVEGEQNFIAGISLRSTQSRRCIRDLGLPTALAADEFEDEISKDVIHIAVGFESGAFIIYQLDLQTSTFMPTYTHDPAAATTITAMTLSGLYLITMNIQQDFTLYHLQLNSLNSNKAHSSQDFGIATVVSSLRSHTVWPPVALSIRRSMHGVFACIVHTIPTFSFGWSVAIQELQLNPEGTSVQKSRIASAVPQGFHHVDLDITPEGNSPLETSNIYADQTSSGTISQTILSQPTSLSYSHPYLLTAHGDNTLTVYLVKSTDKDLEIAPGRQLFGHTSAVSGAHVGSRGRAVSISAKGSELRVWELEGSILGGRRGRESVKVYPSPLRPSLSTSSYPILAYPFSLSSPQFNWRDSAAIDRWLGFDEEKVIVHREKETGRQVLMVYNFS